MAPSLRYGNRTEVIHERKKLKIAGHCLLAAAGIKALITLYAASEVIQLNQQAAKIAAEYPEMKAVTSNYLFDMGTPMMFTAVYIVATFFVLRDLKAEKAWAWVGAITLLVLSAGTIAIPASIIGLIALFDEGVRTEFIAKLNL